MLISNPHPVPVQLSVSKHTVSDFVNIEYCVTKYNVLFFLQLDLVVELGGEKTGRFRVRGYLNK